MTPNPTPPAPTPPAAPLDESGAPEAEAAPSKALEPPSEGAWEDLPEDFWDREPEDEAPRPKAGRAAAALDAPLFAELQSLFPGRLVRLEPREAAGEAPEEPEAGAQDGLFQD